MQCYRKYLLWSMLFIFILVSLLPLKCWGQEGNPFIRNFSRREYGGHSQNWSVVQDKRGVLYFGNVNGLLEFDGQNWRLIELPNYSMVRSLAMDEKGRVYVGGVGEFGYLTLSTNGETIYQSLLPRLDKKEERPGDIWSTLATSHGIYFKTYAGFFRLYQGKIDVIRFTSHSLGFTVGAEIFFLEDGLYRLEGSRARLLPHTESLALEFTGQVFILPYPGNRLLIATRKKGFYLYDLNMLKNEKTNGMNGAVFAVPPTILERFPTEVDTYVNENQLYLCHPISPNHYALATFNGGIVIINNRGKFLRLLDKKNGLQGNRVHDLFEDQHKNLWAVLNNGISYIELNSPITMYNDSNGLEGSIMPILRDGDQLVAATPHGLFTLKAHASPTLGERPGFVPVKNIPCCCWALTQFRENLLVGGAFGVRQVQAGTAENSYYQELVYSFGKTPRFPNHLFLGLREGLVALEFNALNRDKEEKGEPLHVLKQFRFKNLEADIRQIATDKEGNLWLMTQYNGLWYLKFNGGDVWDYQLYRFGAEHGLPRIDWDYLLCLEEQILVCTQSGLYMAATLPGRGFDLSALRFEPEKTISRVLNIGTLPTGPLRQGADGRMWLGFGDTLATFKRLKTGGYSSERTQFLKIRGPIENLLLEEDHLAWIATADGLYRFDLSFQKDYAANYRVLIRRILIDNHDVLAIDPSPPGRELPYKNNSLSFDFAAAFYENPEATRYSYWLEGFNQEWSGWSKEHRAVFTNLPEGKYCFKVKARNIFGHQSDMAVSWFTVAPPWYRSWPAYLVYVVAMMLLLAGAYRVHRFQVKHAVLQERSKYEKCLLEPNQAKIYTKKLLQVMETQKPYLDPNLSLASLAKIVGIQRHFISQVLNIELQKNFWDFIKEYRVEEAKRILDDPRNADLSILQVAFDVGFNSNVTFSQAFKKQTGVSPSKYRSK